MIDYIVVYELCHLHHRDHSAAFWNEVNKVLPGYQEKTEWLRARGAELDLQPPAYATSTGQWWTVSRAFFLSVVEWGQREFGLTKG